MITCCYKCTERWVEDGRTCHSTCKRYADAVAKRLASVSCAKKHKLMNEHLESTRNSTIKQ